jgi:DNA polymerase III subunit gamma/tau
MPETENLATKYRPRRLEDVVGQKLVQLCLSKMIRENKVPQVLLFHGPHGVGKTSVVRILVSSLNCPEEEYPCTDCDCCKDISKGKSDSVIEVDAISLNTTERLEQLKKELLFITGKSKIVVLDNVDKLDSKSSYSLASLLEEPPSNVFFVLTATALDQVDESIATRSIDFGFRRISSKEISDRLSQICDLEEIKVENELVTLIADKSSGLMRNAIMTLDRTIRMDISTTEDFSDQLGSIDFGPVLFKTLLTENLSTTYKLIDEYLVRTGDYTSVLNQISSTVKDVIVLHEGGELTYQGIALENRRALVSSLSLDKCLKVQTIVWELRTKVRTVEDQKTMLYIAVSLLRESLVKKTLNTGKFQEETRVLTLEEMKSYDI